MENLFSLKVLVEIGIKNGRADWYKKATLSKYVRWGFFF